MHFFLSFADVQVASNKQKCVHPDIGDDDHFYQVDEDIFQLIETT